MQTVPLVLLVTCFVCIGYSEYQLVWFDEFNGKFLDETQWNYEIDCWGGGNQEQQCYVKDPQTLYLKDGSLVISQVYYPQMYKGSTVGCTNHIDPASCTSPKPTTSARIRTKFTQSWYYGKFEFRARLPNGSFLWPALWLLQTDNVYGSWAASGEIDIMEYKSQIPNELYQNVWYSLKSKTGVDAVLFPTDFSEDFHIFEFEWTPENMTWFIDGDVSYFLNLNRSFWTDVGPNPYKGANYKPFDQRFHIIINVAVAGNFFGSLKDKFNAATDSQTWTSPLMVDYVRVYQDPSIPVPTPPQVPPVPDVYLEKSWHEPAIVVLIGVSAFELLVILGLLWTRRSSEDEYQDEEGVKSEEATRMIEDYDYH